MPWPWERREREAERLDEVASLLDAGLDLRTALAEACRTPGAAVDRGLIPALDEARLDLDAVDRAVLEAGEAAGEVPRALRERAAARRTRVVASRLLLARLIYPAIVLLMACLVTAWLSWLGLGALGWLSIAIAVFAIAGVIVARVVILRARRDPSFTGAAIPMLGSLLHGLGELPYLEAMRSLYGAGVAIDRAHELATRTVPIAHVRARLAIASQPLADRRGYVESLAMANALEEETRRILDAGERAGHLEQSFAKMATRRRETLARDVHRAVVVTGGILYAIAVLVVVLVVFDFYGGLYSRLGGR